MQKDKVIFKLVGEDQEVIALYPEERWDNRGNIMSYMNIGQHGGASPWLVEELPNASPEQFKALKDELTSIGYDLEVLN